MKIQIKDLATIQMGYSFRSRLEATQNGSVSVIQMKDLLDDNTVDCNNLTTIDMKNLKPHHLVQKGDLVFRSRGLSSTTAILSQNLDNAVVTAPLLRIRVTKPDIILPEYLHWYINQRDAQIFLTSRLEGTAVKKIGKKELENLEIAVPTIQRQKQIIELAMLTTKEQTLLHTLAEKREQYISTLLMKLAKGEYCHG